MGTYEKIRDAALIIEKAGNLELYRELLDVQQEVVDLKAEINRQKEENRDLREQEDIRSQLEFRNHSYYLMGEDGRIDGPYCSGYWDVTGKLVRIHAVEVEGGRFSAKCPVCKTPTNYHTG